MKLKALVYCLGLASMSVDLYAETVLEAYRLGQYDKAAAEFQDKPPVDAFGQFYLGEMNLYGYGLAKNNQQAIQHYQHAAEKGFLPAQQTMARYALLIEKNPEQALMWFKKAADNGDVLAMMYCAGAYLYGYGVNKNEDIARKYYISAAKLGNPLAQSTLAEHFLESKHGKNTALGLLWLNKAVAQHSIPSLMLKAKMLHADGQHDEATRLINLAKKQDYWPAYYWQGLWELESNHYKRAHKLLLTAAKHGHVPAQLALADFYLNQNTKFYHPHYAYLWVLSAAQNQESSAQKKLAEMYQHGLGVEQDDELAKQWLTLSQRPAKRSPQEIEMKLARWLSIEKYDHFTQGDYRLQGIWFDWQNPKALQESHKNNAPKFFELKLTLLFKPEFAMVNPKEIAITEYLDAILRHQGPLNSAGFEFPHYQDYLKQPLDKKAVKHLKHQAYLGVVGAQFVLAQAYQNGVGVKQNLDKAKDWYQKAILQNDLRAQYELALMDLNASDASSKKVALQHLRDAAFKGDALAEYVYGLMSEQGLATADGKILQAPDIGEAKNMYMLASVNQNGLAKFRLAEWLSREDNQSLSMEAKGERYALIKQLYRGAVKDGVKEAELPLAFYEATSKNLKNRDWASQIANHYAAEGKVEAMLLLGLMNEYAQGNGRTAKVWFEKAKDHPIGAFIWASYENDPLLKQALLEKSAKADFPYAYLNLAILKQQQNQSPFEDLQKAVELQNRSASHLLANLMVLDDEHQEAKQQARQIYEKLALKGDVEAEWKLGYLMAKGIGGAKDLSVAEQWITKSAKTSASAQMLMAYLLHLGDLGAAPDDNEAKKWFKLAAKDQAKAWIGLGFIYETVDKNYEAARLAYEQAQDKERTLANYNLGLIYEYGKGTKVDVGQAQKYFLAAAEKGSSHAMMKLAHAYLGGGEQGFYAHEAIAWLKKAAAAGQGDAWYELGLMHEAGVATLLSFDEAKKYYQQAAKLGDRRAMNALARLRHQALDGAASQELFEEAFNGYDQGPHMTYLMILDKLNHQEKSALNRLQQFLESHPQYAPAKHLWLQLKA